MEIEDIKYKGKEIFKMARININYVKYGSSKLATAISFIGGLVCSIILYGGVLLGFALMFTDGISLASVFMGIVVAVICILISVAVQFVVRKISDAVSKK